MAQLKALFLWLFLSLSFPLSNTPQNLPLSPSVSISQPTSFSLLLFLPLLIQPVPTNGCQSLSLDLCWDFCQIIGSFPHNCQVLALFYFCIGQSYMLSVLTKLWMWFGWLIDWLFVWCRYVTFKGLKLHPSHDLSLNSAADHCWSNHMLPVALPLILFCVWSNKLHILTFCFFIVVV